MAKKNSKKNNKKNKNDLLMKEFMVNQVGLLVEVVFVIFTIVVGIATIFQGELLVLFELLMGFTLVSMAYNTFTVNEKKVYSIPYVIGALVAFWAAFEILLGL